MASIRDLKRQIGSVRNQSRVFSALQTVSAVKFRKAEGRAKNARPYAENVEEMMREVAAKSNSDVPMMAGREVNRVAVATLTSDRGLCGAFNAQVLRRTMQLRNEKGRDALQVVSGRKGVSFFRFRGVDIEEEYTGHTDTPSYEDARRIGRRLTQLFEYEEADEVYLVYNRFETALSQKPIATRLLPIVSEDDAEEEEQNDEDEAKVPFEFVPDADTILNELVPRYVETMIWQALLEGSTGEHGARMTAMRSATDNANELADNLTLQMNKARQAQITQELLEIVGGAEALSAG